MIMFYYCIQPIQFQAIVENLSTHLPLSGHTGHILGIHGRFNHFRSLIIEKSLIDDKIQLADITSNIALSSMRMFNYCV